MKRDVRIINPSVNWREVAEDREMEDNFLYGIVLKAATPSPKKLFIKFTKGPPPFFLFTLILELYIPLSYNSTSLICQLYLAITFG